MHSETTSTLPVPTPGQHPRHHWLVGLVIASLCFGLTVIAFHAAVAATPYETVDSAGRTMGFNDVFSEEHYVILWQKVSVLRTIGYMGLYEWLFVACHGLAIFLLTRVRDGVWTLRFCMAQPLIFPWGIPGQALLFVTLWQWLTGTFKNDREGFTDFPYIPMMAHSFWLLVVAVIAWRLMRMRRRRPPRRPRAAASG